MRPEKAKALHDFVLLPFQGGLVIFSLPRALP